MLLHRLKTAVEKIPEPLGKCFARVPYSMRLGSTYQTKKAAIGQFSAMDSSSQREWILNHTREMVTWAGNQHPFYKEYFSACQYGIGHFRDFCDIKDVPIITKADLQCVPLDQRSVAARNRYLTNTGGTSGQPLLFYLDSQAFAREWAHMHFIWERLGYLPTDLKLVFRGKNFGEMPLLYNAVHNEYMVNAYCSYDRVCEAISKKMRRNQIRFLHGYPSSIYDFVEYCREHRPNIVDQLRSSLKGILYASEYPAPCYRDPVDNCLDTPSISWYGHSEFSILAYEVDRYLYAPLHTYGYAEAVPCEVGARLICTGYYNRVCPFIRYDTGDIIEVVDQDEILRTFRISAGRVGDFVTDGDGKQISLTALIFGRHHEIFNHVRFIQVAQRKPGEATIIVTPADSTSFQPEKASSLMDLQHVKMRFDFLVVTCPFRTKAGKIVLKVPHQDLD